LRRADPSSLLPPFVPPSPLCIPLAPLKESSSDDSSDDSSDEEETKDVEMKVEAPVSSSFPFLFLSSSPASRSPSPRPIPLLTYLLLLSTPPPTAKRKASEEPVADYTKKPKVDQAAAFTGEGNPPTTTLWVGNLSWNVDQDWLKSEFEDCGEVTSTRIQMDRETGRS